MKFKFDRHTRRKLLSHTVAVLSGLTVIAVLYPLVSIVYEAVIRGGGVLFQWTFLTAKPPNACDVVSCSTVGIGPAIQGSLLVVAIASLIAVPVGLMAAILASEYRTRGFGRAVSFTADVLTGVPSIIMGAFVWGYFVLYDPSIAESVIAGGIALSAIMTPIVARTTEEALRTVPNAMREAAIALGISKWKMTLRIVLIAALPGIATGVLLAVMRAMGEAAPLLLTLGYTTNYNHSLLQPAAALPVLIYTFAESNYSNQQEVAWGATLFLLMFILAANILSRYMIHRLSQRMSGGA
jgi:phosphate transport system permease protein